MFVDRFITVASARADAIAIVDRDAGNVTYSELLARASGIARELERRGAHREVIVALALQKSADYVAGMLGVWMTGAAFMPLDPSLPASRAELMLRDSGTKLILERPIARGIDELVRPKSVDSDLAYLIYTSGSTGAPKGVLVEHRGILPLANAQISAFALRPESRALWMLSPQFDASISDLTTTLLAGATLVIPPKSFDFLQLARDRKITHVDLPPSLLKLIDPEHLPPSLETIIIGGEPSAPELVRRFAARVRVVNVYGPTETTVCSSLVACDPRTWTRPAIGEPIPGTEFLIEDGELYIGGAGVARGYTDAALTAQRFVTKNGKRYYRTGDRVERHAGGELEFLGRVDRQLKLAGCLVAPEEVEAAIAAHPDVTGVAVIARDGRLTAFVVAKVAIDRRALARNLPRYMIPRRYEFLAELPRTASGKVDLRALAERPLTPHVPRGATPEDPIAIAIAEIWSEILGVADIGDEDEFFDLGGDSYAALEVLAAAERRGIHLESSALSTQRTLKEIASRANRSEAMAAAELRADVASLEKFAPRGAPQSAKTILLTGATGFLGARLLRELRAEKIYCLARGAFDHPHAIRGDLSQPHLGLAHDVWRTLAAEVDAIYHSAAEVNLLLDYAALRPANVLGTHELLRLMSEGREKHLHFMSTLSVFVATDRNTGSPAEDDALASTETVYGGYAQSKFAAELLARSAPGPVSIYRLGLLTGDYDTGRCGPRDWLSLFLRGAELDANAGEDFAVDITPADCAARAIAHLATLPAQTFHVASPRPAKYSELLAAIRRAQRPDGEHGKAAAYLGLQRARAATDPRRSLDLFQATNIQLASEKTQALLASANRSIPPATPELLDRYTRYIFEEHR